MDGDRRASRSWARRTAEDRCRRRALHRRRIRSADRRRPTRQDCPSILVVPAKAGTHFALPHESKWIPAFAGMTGRNEQSPEGHTPMNFSQFFITRPVFAGVLSVIIFIAGADLAAAAADQRVSRSRAADGRRARDAIPARIRRSIAETVAAPLEQAINGVEDMLYMFVAGDQRRRDDADRHVQARHRPRQGAGAGAEPRRAGAAEAARGRAAPRRHDRRSDRPTSRWSCTSSRPTAATTCSICRNYAHAAGAATSSRASPASATCSVFGSGDYAMRMWLDPDKVAAREPDRRATSSTRSASRTCRSPPASSAQPPRAEARADFQLLDQHQGPARRRGGVRRHRHQDRRRRPDHAPARRRARRARRRATTRCARCSTTSPPSRSPIFQRPGANAIADLGRRCARRWRS